MIELGKYPDKEKVRYYEIEAIEIPIVYNKFGDHDPNGLLYVLKKDAEKIREGAIRNFLKDVPQPYEEVKPLVIRANRGDKVVVRFAHSLKRQLSIHVQGLPYDVQTSDGADVGFNRDTTTKDQITYTWYAEREGVYLFHDMADPRSSEEGTNIHGLFGAIVIEPVGAKWHKTSSFAKAIYDEEVVITAPGIDSFRECVVMIQNGIRMLDNKGEIVKTVMGEEEEAIDAEDTGEKGYNYRSERFANRLEKDNRISKVFNSRIHGDPATPVFKAYSGERIIFRTMMPADKPRNVGFCIHGHELKEQPKIVNSKVVSTKGAISIGNTFNMEMKDGASCPGDYLYRSGSLKWDVESGMWGIFRVVRSGIKCKCKNVCRKAVECVCRK